MMKHEGQTQYRFYRPRRPAGMGEGLKLEGMTAKFGLIGIGILMAVGIAMLLVTNTPKENDLAPVTIEVQAAPYESPKLSSSVLLPVKGARVIALDPATFAAADTTKLNALKNGDIITAWLIKKDAESWNAGEARRDFYHAILLRNADNSWLVDYPSYRKKSRVFNNQGWWLIIFGLLLIPYQLIQRPRLPFWIAIIVFAGAVLAWNLLV